MKITFIAAGSLLDPVTPETTPEEILRKESGKFLLLDSTLSKEYLEPTLKQTFIAKPGPPQVQKVPATPTLITSLKKSKIKAKKSKTTIKISESQISKGTKKSPPSVKTPENPVLKGGLPVVQNLLELITQEDAFTEFMKTLRQKK